MIVTEEMAVEAIAELTRDNREFHTAELAALLSKKAGSKVKSDSARFWANKYVLQGILERRQITTRFVLYRKRTGADLPSSVTIRQKEEPKIEPASAPASLRFKN